ncbi:MAG: hypothetical protein JXR07_20665, partial [Reichenbachiella sp.]
VTIETKRVESLEELRSMNLVYVQIDPDTKDKCWMRVINKNTIGIKLQKLIDQGVIYKPVDKIDATV